MEKLLCKGCNVGKDAFIFVMSLVLVAINLYAIGYDVEWVMKAETLRQLFTRSLSTLIAGAYVNAIYHPVRVIGFAFIIYPLYIGVMELWRYEFILKGNIIHFAKKPILISGTSMTSMLSMIRRI